MNIRLQGRYTPKQVAERWHSVYGESDTYREILNAATPDAVDAIMGNGTWTREQCNCCHQLKDVVVLFNELCEDEDVSICMDCVSIASTLISSELAKNNYVL